MGWIKEKAWLCVLKGGVHRWTSSTATGRHYNDLSETKLFWFDRPKDFVTCHDALKFINPQKSESWIGWLGHLIQPCGLLRGEDPSFGWINEIWKRNWCTSQDTCFRFWDTKRAELTTVVEPNRFNHIQSDSIGKTHFALVFSGDLFSAMNAVGGCSTGPSHCRGLGARLRRRSTPAWTRTCSASARGTMWLSSSPGSSAASAYSQMFWYCSRYEVQKRNQLIEQH